MEILGEIRERLAPSLPFPLSLSYPVWEQAEGDAAVLRLLSGKYRPLGFGDTAQRLAEARIAATVYSKTAEGCRDGVSKVFSLLGEGEPEDAEYDGELRRFKAELKWTVNRVITPEEEPEAPINQIYLEGELEI